MARSRASCNLSDFGFLDLAAGVREFHGIACRRVRKIDAVGEELTRYERKIGWFESVEHGESLSRGSREPKRRAADTTQARQGARAFCVRIRAGEKQVCRQATFG